MPVSQKPRKRKSKMPHRIVKDRILQTKDGHCQAKTTWDFVAIVAHKYRDTNGVSKKIGGIGVFRCRQKPDVIGKATFSIK